MVSSNDKTYEDKESRSKYRAAVAALWGHGMVETDFSTEGQCEQRPE